MEKEFDFKNIGKRMPYRTPDGFFGKMQKQVLERTQAERFNRQHRIKLIIGGSIAYVLLKSMSRSGVLQSIQRKLGVQNFAETNS